MSYCIATRHGVQQTSTRENVSDMLAALDETCYVHCQVGRYEQDIFFIHYLLDLPSHQDKHLTT